MRKKGANTMMFETVYPYSMDLKLINGEPTWVATSKILKHVYGVGYTQEEAMSEITQNEDAWIEGARDMGYDIPPITAE